MHWVERRGRGGEKRDEEGERRVRAEEWGGE